MKRDDSARRTLRWMSRTAGTAKLDIAALAVLRVLLGLGGVLYALLFREIVNAAAAGNREGFFRAIAAFAVVAAAHIALYAVSRFLGEYAASTVENRFKMRLFSTLLTKDYASVTGVHSGEWMNRLTSDTAIVAGSVVQIVPGLLGMAAQLIGALAAMLFLARPLVYVAVPGGALIALFAYGFRKILKRLYKEIREADGRLRVFLQERLGSLMVVRAFAQERQSAEQAAVLMDEHRAARMKRNRFSNLTGTGFSIAMNGAYLLGALFCGYGILNGTMSFGNMTAILQLIGQVRSPLVNISGVFSRCYAALASAERLMEAEKFTDDCEGKPVPEAEIRRFYQEQFSGIQLKNLSFTYRPPVRSDGGQEMPVVISGLDLEIRKGECVAFTGPSGCGKSTVLKLLLCLYPLDGGERCLLCRDGVLPLDARWRGLFAYVPQGNQLMSGTVREILTFGDPEKMGQEEQLHRALRTACADGFVNELEQGLDTLLGERGAGLSEGQMQRLAIARAIFSEHPILLLDEATSALDEATEARLLENLRRMTDRTVVIVTHRPAAVAIADKNVRFGTA